MTPITTRLIRKTDLPEIVKMVHALAAHHDENSLLTRDTLERDALGAVPWVTLIVAGRSEKLLGYAALCPLAQLQFGLRGMDMHHLFVWPAARGAGVGQQLIKASIAHARQMRCRYMMVGTHPDNTAAQGLYRAAGFIDAPARGPRFRMRLDSA